MTRFNELAKNLHPSGIEMAAIPMDKSHDKPQPTVQGVLRELAAELRAAMGFEAESFIGACQRMDAERLAKCPGRYEALSEAYGIVWKLWKAIEFDGPPQPEKMWHTLQGHAMAIQQERQNDAAF